MKKCTKCRNHLFDTIFFEVIYVFDNTPVTNKRVSGANLGPTAYEPMGPKMAFLARKLYKMAFQMHSHISMNDIVFVIKRQLHTKTAEIQ